MARFRMPASSREEIRRGIALMVVNVFIFAVVNALIKWQVVLYPVTEIIFFRCLFALIPCAVMVMASGGWSSLRTRRFGAHVGRGALHVLSLSCMFLAFRLMPLADAVAVAYAAPLFYTMLSIPFLGERVGIHRWSAVAFGFVGVLIMVRPGTGVIEAGALFALLNAFFASLVSLNIRRMTLTETTVVVVTYQLLAMALLTSLTLPFAWVTPSLLDGAIMVLIGLLAGGGQFLLTQAYRYLPAAVGAPFHYTSLIWATLFGFVFWDEVPTAALLTGAAIVIASGLYIAYREAIRHQSVRGG
ncbi:MAG: DMT family transporter [Proteobacteria bacterium]|nr:DMT family transporter [Pseudomonadota bacterium]